ncbi:MAG: nitroreductase family protein [Methanobacteriaceae archaeon]
MNDLEAVNKRISRRKYIKTHIDDEKVAIIKSKINEINKESGLAIEFLEDGSSAFKGIKNNYGMFSGVKSIIILKSNSLNSNTNDNPNNGNTDNDITNNDIHLKEKIGYYGEILVLEATKLGLGTCWVGGTFNRKDKAFKNIGNQDFVCVIPIGNVSDSKTIKERIIRKMTHINSKSIEKLYNSADNEKFPEWFINGIIAVSKAPTAINSQKFRFKYSDGEVTATIPDSYLFDLVDLGIGKLHFEIATGKKFELGNPGKLKD